MGASIRRSPTFCCLGQAPGRPLGAGMRPRQMARLQTFDAEASRAPPLFARGVPVVSAGTRAHPARVAAHGFKIRHGVAARRFCFLWHGWWGGGCMGWQLVLQESWRSFTLTLWPMC